MGSHLQVILFIFLLHIIAGLTAHAESSFELSCRNKAKEIAAETYKNCVTEQREAQLQQIRNEYKEKLSDLKNHYDKELKKLSTTKSEIHTQPTSKQSLNTKSMRASGARNLPKKSVKTEVIDLSSPSVEPTALESHQESQNRLKTDSEQIPDAEIVELPQQE